MFEKIKEALAGKKTYLVAVSSIIGVVIAWSTGNMDTVTAVQSIIACIMSMTIRNGIN